MPLHAQQGLSPASYKKRSWSDSLVTNNRSWKNEPDPCNGFPRIKPVCLHQLQCD
jgi:hypothetical protein